MPAKEAGTIVERMVACLSHAAFQQHRETRGIQFGVIARDRHQTAFGDIEGNDGDVRRGVALPRAVGRRDWIGVLRGKQIVERHDPVGKMAAKTAHVTDGEHVGCHCHGELAMIERSDAAAGDQRLGADPRQRGDGFGAAAQERQRRCDHSGAQHTERDEDALDDVGQLDDDDEVGRQPHLAQPPGDGRHDAVGLGIGQPARRAIGEGLAVRRIHQRESVGTPPRVMAEHLVDGDGGRALRRRRRGNGRIAEDHCSVRSG